MRVRITFSDSTGEHELPACDTADLVRSFGLSEAEVAGLEESWRSPAAARSTAGVCAPPHSQEIPDDYTGSARPMLSLAAGGMIMPQRLALLTPRQYEIAVLISKGLCNKRIARELCISVGVVKLHLHRAYRKAGVRGRTQLAVLVVSSQKEAA
jgi:DNA-binding NarL/FixJ family response regulator